MALTLLDLLSDPVLALVPEGRSPASMLPVQWVAVTELEDPRPFLTGAEVVLTTGVRLRTVSTQRSFVRSTHAAGALAIGFGIGFAHERTPPALLAEADAVGLPVFRVPYDVPFIAIGKKVSDSLSADHYAGLEDLLEGHAVLASALLGAGGLGALLDRLARMLGTDVALFQYGARIAGAGTAPRELPATGDTAVGDRLTPGTRWHRVPIATGLKDRCTLAIGEPYAHSGVVDYAQSLISVELTNQARNRKGARRALGQLLEDVVRGTLAGPDGAARLASSGIDATQRHSVLIIDVAANHRRTLGTLPLPDGWSEARSGMVDDRLVLVLPTSGTPDPARLTGYLDGAGLTSRIGVGGAYTHPNGLRWSYFEAREALLRGQSLNRADRLSLTSLLMSSADVPLADLAAETLGPLEAFDDTHGAGLTMTLQRYLELDGSVAAVAAELDVHRNTVRYRLQQVIALCGYDPSVTADRVHLYLALRVRALEKGNL
ncbi:PucR family transcriptional regulator [Arthrobacter echini]|uniref:PucR family transcriptional regulator n=1 Tax=Arthrobacter echini TaxID=1529066 RepID=A0A4S5E4V2_9MICC|nr:PucR family transcriptional regulator [Arthrobacter echini]THJ66525.1 PucR family transcriptional regulator [Arthrobacter echini]